MTKTKLKLFSKILLTLYLLVLAWLVLFKFSLDISTVLDHQVRSLNLIPFSDSFDQNLSGGLREVIYNCLVFIPLGLLLSANLKRATSRQKLVFIFIFSLGLEIFQYLFAIGATDITDILTNTFGGYLGLKLYNLSSKYVSEEKLDRIIVVAGAILLILFILLRVLVFRVSYHSAP